MSEINSFDPKALAMSDERQANRCYPPAGYTESVSDADSDDFDPYQDIDDYTAAFIPPDHPDPRVRAVVDYWRNRNPNAAYLRQPGVPGVLGDYVDVDAFEHPEHLVHGENGLRDPAPLDDLGPAIHAENGNAEGTSDDEAPAEATAAPLPAHIEAMDDDEWDTFLEELGQVRAGAVRQAVQEVADNLAALDASGLDTIARARRVLDSVATDTEQEDNSSVDSQATTVAGSPRPARGPQVGDGAVEEPAALPPGSRVELPCHSQDETLPCGVVVRNTTILNNNPENKNVQFYTDGTASADAPLAGPVATASCPPVGPALPVPALAPHDVISGREQTDGNDLAGQPLPGPANQPTAEAALNDSMEVEVREEREEGEIEPYVPQPVPARGEREREEPLPIAPLPDRGPIDQRRYLRLQNPGMRGSLRTRRRRQTRARQALRARGVDPALIYYRYEWHRPRWNHWRRH